MIDTSRMQTGPYLEPGLLIAEALLTSAEWQKFIFRCSMERIDGAKERACLEDIRRVLDVSPFFLSISHSLCLHTITFPAVAPLVAQVWHHLVFVFWGPNLCSTWCDPACLHKCACCCVRYWTEISHIKENLHFLPFVVRFWVWRCCCRKSCCATYARESWLVGVR